MRHLVIVTLALFCTCARSNAQTAQDLDPYLVELGDSLWNTVFKDPRHAMQLANELMVRSEKARYYKGQLQAERGIAESYYALQKLDSSNHWYGIALQRTRLQKDDRNGSKIHGAIGTNFLELGLSDSCLQHMHQALLISTSLKDSSLICSAYVRLGKARRRLFQHTEAIRDLQAALRYCDQEGTRNQLALANLTLAIIHDQQKDRTTALRCALEAQRLFAEQGDTWNLVPTLNTIAVIHYGNGAREQAKSMLLQARRAAVEAGHLRLFVSTSYNLASHLLDDSKPDSARVITEELLVQARSTGDRSDLCDGLTVLGRAYLDLGQYAQARDTLLRAIALAEEAENLGTLKEGNLLLSNTYAKLGNYDLAWRSTTAHMRYKDSLYTLEKTAEIDRLQTEFDAEKKDLHIADLLERETLEKAKNRWLWIGIAALGIAALSIVLIIIQKRRRDLAQIKIELALERSEKERLDEQLDHKRRELTAKALHLAQKNELLKDLKEQLSTIRANNSESALQQIGNSIRFDEQIDQNWDQFTIAFTETNAGFFDRLRAAHPDISKSELRLAALLSMNLNSKEIGAILNISDEGVRKGRYRLRKKLGLETTDGLEQHLATL